MIVLIYGTYRTGNAVIVVFFQKIVTCFAEPPVKVASGLVT
jgi:hypothetical protein